MKAVRVAQGLSLRGLSYFSQLAVPIALSELGVHGLKLWALIFTGWALSALGSVLSTLMLRRRLKWLPILGVFSGLVMPFLNGETILLAFYIISFVSAYTTFFVVASAYEAESSSGIFRVMAGNSAGLMVGSAGAALLVFFKPASSALVILMSAIALAATWNAEPTRGAGPAPQVLRGIFHPKDIFLVTLASSLAWAAYTSYSAPAFSGVSPQGAELAALAAFSINAASFAVRLMLSRVEIKEPERLAIVSSAAYAVGMAFLFIFLRFPSEAALGVAIAAIAASHSIFPPLSLSEFFRRGRSREAGFLSYNLSTGLGDVLSNALAFAFVVYDEYGPLFLFIAAVVSALILLSGGLRG